MPYELCRHIKANGLRCQSPALTDENWCFFHHRLIARHRQLNELKTEKPAITLQLPPLEDRESIQVALSLVTDAILTGLLSEKRAAILLRAIAVASRNARDLNTQPCHTEKIVRASFPTTDGFHLDYRRMNDFSSPPARKPAPAPAQPNSALPNSAPPAQTPAPAASQNALS